MIYTLPDLIRGMREEITARSEIYARRVAAGQMDQEKCDERLAMLEAVVKVLVAVDILRTGCDAAIVPAAWPRTPQPPPLPAPHSQSQRIALRALIKRLIEVGIGYDEMQERMKNLTGAASRNELTSEQAAKCVASFEAWAEEKEGEVARMNGQMATVEKGDVPF
jgi:hypothetical protein